MSRRHTHPRSALIALVAIAALALLPAVSLAQSSSVGGYGGSGGEVQSALNSGGDSGSSGDSGSGSAKAGSLPFTGLDLGWMVGGGIVLVGAGIAMGRAASRAPEAR